MSNNQKPIMMEKPSRPCTGKPHHRSLNFENSGIPLTSSSEYNLFFQLERAYILQVELGAAPETEERFTTTQESYARHDLPPLPARYSYLTLAYDWFLPGKEKRRKRKHRKSHGKISFQELSLKVAAAWKVVPDHIRLYCSQVCSAGMDHYKAGMLEWRRLQGEDVDDSGSEPETKRRRKATGKQSAPATVQRHSIRPKRSTVLNVNFYSNDESSQEDEDMAPTPEATLPSLPPMQVLSDHTLADMPVDVFGQDPETWTDLESDPLPCEPFEVPSVNLDSETSESSPVNMSDEEIWDIWNVPRRRSSYALGFGMTNTQFINGHLPLNTPSGIPQHQPQQHQSSKTFQALKTAVMEHNRVKLTPQQSTFRARAA